MTGRKPSKQSEAAPPKSWRDVLLIHKAADLFPMMSEPELRELGEDIKKHGLQSPIVIGLKAGINHQSARAEDFELWDGRNRLAAMELAEIPFTLQFQQKHKWGPWWFLEGDYETAEGVDFGINIKLGTDTAEAYDYIISANIHRRHLTPELKRKLIADAIAMQPHKSDRAIAEQTKTSPTTVGAVRKATVQAGQLAPEKRTGKDGKVRKLPAKKMPPSKTAPAAAAAQAMPGSIGPMLPPDPFPDYPDLPACLDRRAQANSASPPAAPETAEPEPVIAAEIARFVSKLIGFDLELAARLWDILRDDDAAARLRTVLDTEITIAARTDAGVGKQLH